MSKTRISQAQLKRTPLELQIHRPFGSEVMRMRSMPKAMRLFKQHSGGSNLSVFLIDRRRGFLLRTYYSESQ
jgi:hypothetical protein